MKKTLLFLLTLITLTAFSQDQEAESSTYKKVLIGVSVSPDYCFRTLSNNGGDEFSDLIISLRNNQEI